MIHIVKIFGVVNKAEVYVFLELSCFFNDPDNHNGVITHLEPDILECQMALGSITMSKASGGDGIPFDLFNS